VKAVDNETIAVVDEQQHLNTTKATTISPAINTTVAIQATSSKPIESLSNVTTVAGKDGINNETAVTTNAPAVNVTHAAVTQPMTTIIEIADRVQNITAVPAIVTPIPLKIDNTTTVAPARNTSGTGLNSVPLFTFYISFSLSITDGHRVPA
jgi:hypothetical protein